MKKTLEALNLLVTDGILRSYAIGGAMGAMFYTEAMNTEDLDIFTVLPYAKSGLITLKPLYDELAARGYKADHEHVVIEGIPVQFLPAYNPLIEEALDNAIDREVANIPTRVPSAEYLCAIALQTGRPKDIARVDLFITQYLVDLQTLNTICRKHNIVVPNEIKRKTRTRSTNTSQRKRSNDGPGIE